MEASERLQFPPFFPSIRKGCEAAADALFDCLQSQAIPGNTLTTERAVSAQCKQVMETYANCTRKSLCEKSTPPPSVAVEFATSK